eukprot:scaffold11940_cov116-Cylindrotheca_fusiformis.AAC.2
MIIEKKEAGDDVSERDRDTRREETKSPHHRIYHRGIESFTSMQTNKRANERMYKTTVEVCDTRLDIGHWAGRRRGLSEFKFQSRL